MSQLPATFPFLARFPTLGRAGMAPLLPVVLAANGIQVNLHGLPDTGAMTNVLPYSAGAHLGFDWAAQTLVVPVGGILASLEARLVMVAVTVPSFEPVVMPFAWLENDGAPLLLGEQTFFDEFDVCFFRSRLVFEVRRRQP